MQEKFSPQHSFTRSEVEDATKTVAHEARARKLLIRVTTGHRALALRQFVANQLAFVCAVPLIFVTALYAQPDDHGRIYQWMAIAVGSWLLRLAAYYRVFKEPPSGVARSLKLRLIPLAMISMSTVFWMWTVVIFVGPVFTATAAVLLLGLIALSIAMIGMWPTTPVAAASQLTLVWGTVVFEVVRNGLAPWPLVLAALGMLAVTLWVVVYVSVSQVNPHLERSDEMDLLVAELRDANVQLEAFKNELWTQLSKRSSFFAGASHDFRQRVHAFKLLIVSAVQSHREDAPSKWALQRVQGELDEIETYMTDVLDFARIEAMDTSPHVTKVELQRIFQRLDLQFSPVAEARALDLKLRTTDAILMTDGAMLQRMLENLVSNALRFTRHRVLVAARPHRDGIAIEVWDQGPGLDDGELERIFDAFYQSESQQAAQRGLGLGLAIVRRFADSLGYSISARAKVGRGSMFRLHIPASAVTSSENNRYQ